MEKLTLEQCNALPITDLFIATIEEPMDSEHSKAFLQCDLDEAKNAEELISKAKESIDESIASVMEQNGEEELTQEQEDFFKLLSDGFLSMAVSFTRTAVVYKLSDGTYLDLNGFGNDIYGEEKVKFIEPFSDYYEEGTFRFIEGPEDAEEPNRRGIHIDVDELDGVDQYTDKMKKIYKQYEADFLT
ncbi:MAG: hypothetical protein IKQ33_06130 [Clostridia bacterium]|nr:hypothetical protein [Clostridia bacterium]